MMDKDILTRTMGADVVILMSDKIDFIMKTKKFLERK